MKAKKLYVCGTAFSWDRDTTNSGAISFYTSKKALKDDCSCWGECGIVEVDLGDNDDLHKFVVKPKKRSKKKVATIEEFKAKEDLYISLAEKIIKMCSKYDDDIALSATLWAKAVIKDKVKKNVR